jgi:hypothetical protein
VSDKIIDQPAPIHQPDRVPVWNEVIKDVIEKFKFSITPTLVVIREVLDDMAARDAVGRERYGTPLTTHNGRDHVVDAYQELLDAVVYLKTGMLESIPIPPTLYMRLLEDIVFVRRMIGARAEAKKVSGQE